MEDSRINQALEILEWKCRSIELQQLVQSEISSLANGDKDDFLLDFKFEHHMHESATIDKLQ